MNLKNESYVIFIGAKNFTEKYYKEKNGWLKNLRKSEEIVHSIRRL